MPITTSSTTIDPSRGGAGAGGAGATDLALVLTAPGVAALATVRLCGPSVASLLSRHFGVPVMEGRCVHGNFIVDGRFIDDPVVVYDAHRQCADVHVHGGYWVLHEVLEAARAGGFKVIERPALPLPPEAVDGQSAIEREILQWLPMAATQEAAASLLGQEEAWKALLKRVEVGAGAAFDPAALCADASLTWLLQGPRVAIIGIPNAGKSTLANALFARDRSITADLPGTTRDWVQDMANLDGLPIHLIDTPGLRAADCAIERQAIASARPVIEQADLILLLLDPTQAQEPQETLRAAYPNAMVVRGKADLPGGGPAAEGVLAVSGQRGMGVAELRTAIRARFGCQRLPLDRPCVWTQRQRQLLTGAGPCSPAEAVRRIVGSAGAAEA